MNWKTKNNKLTKEFTFEDFDEALAFIVRVGLLAEKHKHHPEILNVYNTVTLSLTTHDEGSVVTEKDKKLAEAIDDIPRIK